MNKTSYTQEVVVVKNPSKRLMDIMTKLSDRKKSQQEKLRNKANCPIQIKL